MSETSSSADLSARAAAVAAKRARRHAKSSALNISGADNTISHGPGVTLSGAIIGARNRVEIADPVGETFNLKLDIHGNDNLIRIGPGAAIRGLSVYIGNHIPAHATRLEIGANYSISRGGVFYLFNSGNALSFGDDCLLSYNTIVRCGESPHLIFDRATGAYLDVTEPLIIGNHVWIGENAYITKRAGLADHSIVAACSVVTKRFDEPYCAIGGNPARVVRRGWNGCAIPPCCSPDRRKRPAIWHNRRAFTTMKRVSPWRALAAPMRAC